MIVDVLRSCFGAVAQCLDLYDVTILKATCKLCHIEARTVLAQRIPAAECDDGSQALLSPVCAGKGSDAGTLNQADQDMQQHQVAVFVLNPARINAELIWEGEAAQGGPIFASPLHIAARLGDLQLCRTLVRLGADVNTNLFIPNDQESDDFSVSGANSASGSDWSQYRWGLITPMRIALLFGHGEVAQFLSRNGGIPGKARHTQMANSIGSSFANRGRPGFSSLADDECWTNSTETELYYLNTYMHGKRVYPGVLYSRGNHQDEPVDFVDQDLAPYRLTGLLTALQQMDQDRAGAP